MPRSLVASASLCHTAQIMCPCPMVRSDGLPVAMRHTSNTLESISLMPRSWTVRMSFALMRA